MPDPSTYQSIGWVLLGLAGLALAANQIHDLLARLIGDRNKREISPQPLEVREADDFISSGAFERHCEENARDFHELRQRRDSDLAASDESRRRIYDKIDKLTAKVEELPGKIVADILNTKKLFRDDNS